MISLSALEPLERFHALFCRNCLSLKVAHATRPRPVGIIQDRVIGINLLTSRWNCHNVSILLSKTYCSKIKKMLYP